MLYTGTIAPLTRKRERMLLRRAKKGDLEAREELIHANIRFVVDIASYYDQFRRGIEQDDLVSEGIDGLIEAIERYDMNSNNKLISYAVHWIRQRIRMALTGDDIVRRPGGLITHIQKYIKMQKKMENSTFDEICDEMDLSEQIRIDLAGQLRGDLSMDAPSKYDKPIQYKDHQPSAEVMLIENTINTTIQTGVDSLNGRRKQILTMYFGLDGEEPKTLQAIGDIIGVTRERVRQLKEMAMDDLKQEINYEELAAPVI